MPGRHGQRVPTMNAVATWDQHLDFNINIYTSLGQHLPLQAPQTRGSTHASTTPPWPPRWLNGLAPQDRKRYRPLR